MGLLETKCVSFQTETEKKLLGFLEAENDGRFEKYLEDQGFDLKKKIYCMRDYNGLIYELRQ